MVDNKSKTSLIGHIQKNISLIKIHNIINMLHTRIILLSSSVIYLFCKCHSGSFPIILMMERRDDTRIYGFTEIWNERKVTHNKWLNKKVGEYN